MQEFVSVAIIARGKGQYIDKCISSLLNQTYTNFEIVIVEDPPFDGSGEIINAFGEKIKKY